MTTVPPSIRARLMRGGFARNVLLLAGGTGLGQAIVLLASPILTRLYTPDDFGILAIFASVLAISATVATLRYELAIPLPESDERAANLTVLSMLIALFMSLMLGLVLWGYGDLFVAAVNAPALGPYLWLLPLSLFGVGIYQAGSYWAIRKGAYPQLAKTRVSQGVATVATQVGVGIAAVGSVGLLLGDVLGRMAGSGSLLWLAWRRNKAEFVNVQWSGIVAAAKRYRRFPLIGSGSAILNSSGWQLAPIILAAFFSSTMVGLFALGNRVISAPLALVGRSVAQVFMGEASRLAQSDPSLLRKLYLQTARNLFLLGLVPTAIMALGGPWIFSVAFGEAWHEAGVYVRILAPMFLVQFVVNPITQTLNVLERQDLQLAWDVARFVLVIGGLLLAGLLEFPARVTIAVYGGTMLVCYAALFVFTLSAMHRRVVSP